MKLTEQQPAQIASYRSLPLSQGEFAIVDASDYERCNQFKWTLWRVKKHWRVSSYAIRRARKNEGFGTIKLHRFILGITDPKVEIDHRDHNGLNCVRSNLRIASRTENLQNARRHANTKSGYKGVYWHEHSKCWFSRIRVNKKDIYLGIFPSIMEAAKAYDRAALRYFGEFAHINFPLPF